MKLGMNVAIVFVVLVMLDGQPGRPVRGVLPGIFHLMDMIVNKFEAAGADAQKTDRQKHRGNAPDRAENSPGDDHATITPLVQLSCK
jgi:hypothetical protein